MKVDEKCLMLIEVRMIIGFGFLNKLGKLVLYGFLFGVEEIKLMKEVYVWIVE